ncbi:PepSY domain-containing protein [Novosphingobium pentaromativorans]|uniref:PepSY domain-containing protein n=1 Tax=Novosphingobium pentaromativorans US6-1 TaxID=1088721 RepID=G6EDY8_9SPHN|nr:PepSY domain-containing protein [Novosphingobium pentaromativorans]EHJ60429.1 hypothetical protein NSU_2559 [Novosphingobium pentaromativorans US6-1]MAM40261.1 hypothetical protein [Erythrobacter sp.]|tara:strand:+ start:1223 stop:1951 length:729 start_codon:yes stop_codon:yes gene_type:complete
MTGQRSRKLRLHIFGSKVHKWLAVFVGVQALLWTATGTIMSFLKIEHVRSEHVISREPLPLGVDAPLPAWAANEGDLVSATTKTVNGDPVVELKRVDGSATLHEAVTGRKLSPLSRDAAEQIASAAWTGPSTAIKSSMSIEAPVGTEFGGPFPAWQVQFADPDGTRLYIDASTGAVLAARSDTWRLFDLVWGLHIMDWTQRDRINSWWLLLFGIGGTVIAISGFVLLANRFPKLRRNRAKGP